MMKKFTILWGLFFVVIMLFTGTSLAQDKASPDEVYEKTMNGVEVLLGLGASGLEAFNDPKGEFVWKDSYVFIINCSTMKILAHPSPKRVGADISENRDKNPDPAKVINQSVEMCKIAENPRGGWVAYW